MVEPRRSRDERDDRGGRMRDIQDALGRVGKSLAGIAQAIVKAMDKLTPEQRIVIEFLAENPEIVEAFQELNQRLARQRAMKGGNIQTSKVPEIGNCQRYRFEVLVSNEFDEDASKGLKKSYLMRVLSEEIDRQLERE